MAELSEVLFTSEQLYTLIDGPDYNRFVIPQALVPVGYMGDDAVMEEMRSKLISAFSSVGIVDEGGRPCPALAKLVEPIRECRLDLSNGFLPSDEREDMRTWSICFGTRYATVSTISTEPYRVGYCLRSLGKPKDWEREFATLTGLDRLFHYSPQPFAFVCNGEKEGRLLVSTMNGNTKDAEKLAWIKEVPPDMLRIFAAGMVSPESGYEVFEVNDYRRQQLAGPAQVRDLRQGPQLKTAVGVLPNMGFVCRDEVEFSRAIEDGSWQFSDSTQRRHSFESVGSGSVLARVLGIDQQGWNQLVSGGEK
ncbi:hypothetical protein OZX62_07415 [Bifidobacterium sp. ESL0690]|uniref:hypothetical protein n=1 Tax=Bifidobacterium sp. ESL0690 TaxID=2983214 RepID=UPI0023F66008|nr:hypothetical protein [Bifidobacterium sp. ESL0690]WEV46266.1 hypothetical protein OZX62_07415 [Bifidobacterium sp. ESL0690]